MPGRGLLGEQAPGTRKQSCSWNSCPQPWLLGHHAQACQQHLCLLMLCKGECHSIAAGPGAGASGKALEVPPSLCVHIPRSLSSELSHFLVNLFFIHVKIPQAAHLHPSKFICPLRQGPTKPPASSSSPKQFICLLRQGPTKSTGGLQGQLGPSLVPTSDMQLLSLLTLLQSSP